MYILLYFLQLISNFILGYFSGNIMCVQTYHIFLAQKFKSTQTGMNALCELFHNFSIFSIFYTFKYRTNENVYIDIATCKFTLIEYILHDIHEYLTYK